MALTLITAPAVTPISVADVKAQTRVGHAAEDALIEGYIAAAVDQGQIITHAQFVAAIYELVLDCFPAADYIELPRPPLASVTSVKYLDGNRVEQTLTKDTHYRVDTDRKPGRVYLAYGQSWPSTYSEPNAVRVRFVAGWATAADVPAAIKSWLLMRAADLYANRESIIVAPGQSVQVLPYEHVGGLLDAYTYRVVA